MCRIALEERKALLAASAFYRNLEVSKGEMRPRSATPRCMYTAGSACRLWMPHACDSQAEIRRRIDSGSDGGGDAMSEPRRRLAALVCYGLGSVQR